MPIPSRIPLRETPTRALLLTIAMQGVWLRDRWIQIASYLTKVSFYTNWDVKLNAAA